KNFGSVGVQRIKDFNNALLTKWWQNLGGDTPALWNDVMFAKYGRKSLGWSIKQKPSSHLPHVWKGLNHLRDDFDAGSFFYCGRRCQNSV
ncbi:hypothetical protein DVA81_18655, partial [Acinetobacter baumannii]